MKPITSFAEANHYLTSFYLNARVEYSLDNMLALMEFLGNPQEKFKTVHIAGTSGKTSTAYYASALLSATGAKTGLSVSPHVDAINERVQINNQPLPEKEFCEALTEFLGIVQQASVKPSWFEAMVAFAYWYFAREGMDYVVVEVGLGGLKDGTNVITRPDKVCIITDIGLDHINVLGRTLDEIAGQKAGIIQPGNTVFTYEQAPEIMKAFKKRCAGQKANMQIIQTSTDSIGLPGYQQRNWQLAREAINFIINRDNLPGLGQSALEETRQIKIPGRMDVRQVKGKTLIMDGAHNAQKMTAFLESFKKLYLDTKPAILISLKHGKDYHELAPLLVPVASRVIITTYEATQDTPSRSMEPRVLAEAFSKAGLSPAVIEDQALAVKELLNGPETVCVITGSFYLLSQIRNNGLLDD